MWYVYHLVSLNSCAPPVKPSAQGRELPLESCLVCMSVSVWMSVCVHLYAQRKLIDNYPDYLTTIYTSNGKSQQIQFLTVEILSQLRSEAL